MAQIKLSDWLMNGLAHIGVGNVMLVPGGFAMHLVDSLGYHPTLKYTTFPHEQAAAFAAGAYAGIKGVGACLITSGPGATNAVTGCLSAYQDQLAVIFISGQSKTQDLHAWGRIRGTQYAPIEEMVRPITSRMWDYPEVRTVMSAGDIYQHFYEARRGLKYGPAWIDIPLDVQAEMIEDLPYEDPPDASIYPSNEDVSILVQALKGAKRPLVVAGWGARNTKIVGFCLQSDSGYCLTWRAINLPDVGEPHYFGRHGGMGQRIANEAIQVADVLLILGARCDDDSVGYNITDFGKNAKRFIVNNFRPDMEKFQRDGDVKIFADCEAFVERMIELW
jgi:acetolactate synthase-1/2/3 large subunit